MPFELEIPKKGTEVRVMKLNSTVEVVFQGTNLVVAMDHPMHLHGFSFYVVGWGFGDLGILMRRRTLRTIIWSIRRYVTPSLSPETAGLPLGLPPITQVRCY